MPTDFIIKDLNKTTATGRKLLNIEKFVFWTDMQEVIVQQSSETPDPSIHFVHVCLHNLRSFSTTQKFYPEQNSSLFYVK